MDGYSVLCLLLAGGGVLFGLIQRLRARRQLAQMDRMLDRALEGQFQETAFDESAPSALEAKLARFLNGSAASARGLAEERGKIAALIADISTRPRPPSPPCCCTPPCWRRAPSPRSSGSRPGWSRPRRKSCGFSSKPW